MKTRNTRWDTFYCFAVRSCRGTCTERNLCGEIARDSKGTGKPGATWNLESKVEPTEFPTANPIAQTDAEVQGNSLRDFEQNFAKLPEQKRDQPLLQCWFLGEN